MGSDGCSRRGESRVIMARFLTKLCWEDADNTDDGLYIVTAPLFYASDVAQQNFVVPPGFLTDGNSTPRWPFVYWLMGGRDHKPAVLHDYLYDSKQVSRTMADAVLREASASIGVPAWRRWGMWAAVRIWGGSHWAPTVTPLL